MLIDIFSELEWDYSKEDRDNLYTNNINPVCNFRKKGITALGQKTLLRDTVDINGNTTVSLLNKFSILILLNSILPKFN